LQLELNKLTERPMTTLDPRLALYAGADYFEVFGVRQYTYW